MSNQSKPEDVPTQSTNGQELGNPVAQGWGVIDRIKEEYRKTKEHAQAYPYVWASYILVYGGFGFWLTYRWRALRRTEDRVRALQEEVRKVYEAEELAESRARDQLSKSANKPPPPSTDKAAKK